MTLLSQKETQKTTADWLTIVKENSDFEIRGKYLAKDQTDVPVILEWKRVGIKSPELAEFKEEISKIASQTLAPIEMEFLRKYPEAVQQELFLKSCAPLLEKVTEAVDWTSVKKKIQSTIKEFYLLDLSSFGDEMIKPLLNDLYFIITIRNCDLEEPLGFAMFAVTPSLQFGNVKVINVVVVKCEQKRGLEQLLMSSIFNIIPDITRLFAFTRPTNEYGVKLHRDWGFTDDKSGFEDPNHKVNQEYMLQFEYETEKSDYLQKIAATFCPKI